MKPDSYFQVAGNTITYRAHDIDLKKDKDDKSAGDGAGGGGGFGFGGGGAGGGGGFAAGALVWCVNRAGDFGLGAAAGGGDRSAFGLLDARAAWAGPIPWIEKLSV